MGLGNNSGGARTFLTVGFGKIRQKSLANKEKVTSETEGAVKRITQSGNESWALEYDFIEGMIENIFYKEDREYGNSLEVTISEAADLFQISFSEKSRYCDDFLKKLPNIVLSEPVKITVYDFEDKEGKKRTGTSITQAEAKVKSFYSDNVDEKWVLKNNFPDPDGVDFKDENERNYYFGKCRKFLREEFKERFEGKFKQQTANKEVSSPFVDSSDADLQTMADNEPIDDLPY